MNRNDASLYQRWIVANGWAEAIGLGTTLLLGRAAAPLLATADPAGILVGGVAAVALGTLLEGTVVGAAQEHVLRKALSGLRPRAWTYATMLGAGTAWILGMVPSTVMALSSGSESGPAPVEPPAALQYGLAVLLGAVTGPVLGFAQWLVLRRHHRRAGLWLGANAVAWAVGMPLIFLGMDSIAWERGPLAIGAGVYAVCAITGLCVGGIHGRFLVHLLSQGEPSGSAGGPS